MSVGVGGRLGRWRVRSLVRGGAHLRAYVSCQGGTDKLVRVSTLISGESKSCGCLARELAGDRVRTHGLSKHPLFQTWYDMYRRCNRSSRKDYHHYGGRGIKVDDRWMPPAEVGFTNFIEDMLPSYVDGLEIDRIDVDGDYEPSNCRWVTRSVNCSNKRSYFIDYQLEHNGEKICLSELSRKTGIPNRVLWDRMFKLEWDYDKAITTPMKLKAILVVTEGKEIPLPQFCKEYAVNYIYFNTIKGRLGLAAACEKFLRPFHPDKLIGKVNSEFIELYDFNQTLENINDQTNE